MRIVPVKRGVGISFDDAKLPGMSGSIVEVKDAVVSTYDGDKLEVQGGAYLSPDAWLSTELELSRLRAQKEDLERKSYLVPGLIVGAALFGAAFGYWYAREDE
ncbi:MAG: hypothetical protein DI536_09975 [Archangium gephyra]|uniref:Uncharacterized protein n=1 Tax=Archangium gephyra TaxID=48 RepID=A0A2W5VUX4_9BACT|nr:MAG: hypothetical protein DI536_09975 [Archangium gephyra]